MLSDILALNFFMTFSLSSSHGSFIQQLVANHNRMHSCFFLFIKIKAQHIPRGKPEVIKVSNDLAFALCVVSLTMPYL